MRYLNHYKILLLVFAVSFSLYATELGFEKAYEHGLSFEKEKKYASALKVYKELARKYPWQFGIYNRIAFCFDQLSYFDLAQKYWRKTLEYSPLDSEAIERLREYKSRELKQKPPETEVIYGNIKRPEKEELPQSRLWFTANGFLYTTYLDGRDFRPFSSENFGLIYPAQTGGFGFACQITDEEGKSYISFVNTVRRDIERLTPIKKQDFLPLYIPAKDGVYALRLVEERKIPVFYPLKDKEKELLFDKEFSEVTEWIYHEKSESFFVLAEEGQKGQKVWIWDGAKSSTLLSTGDAKRRGMVVSSDATRIVWQEETLDKGWNYYLVDIVNRNFQKLTHFGSEFLSACFDVSSHRLFFSSTISGERDRWVTTVAVMDLENKFVTSLLETNFLIEGLFLDEAGDFLYYRTNYDNNFELYRLPLGKPGEPQRLTITDEDETQAGLWPTSLPSQI